MEFGSLVMLNLIPAFWLCKSLAGKTVHVICFQMFTILVIESNYAVQ